MTKGTSPLRLLIRGSPRKSTQETIEPNSSNATIAIPTRKALTPIVEGVSNPLIPDSFSIEATTPSGKADTTPKRRSVGYGSFPDTENTGELKEGTAIGTPGKLAGITPGRSKNILAGLSKKSPSVNRTVKESGQFDLQTEGNVTPSRKSLVQNLEGFLTGNSVRGSNKTVSEVTPRGFRSVGRKGTHELDACASTRCSSSQLMNGTPSGSRAVRSLKYGASIGSGHVRASATNLLSRQLSMPQMSHLVGEQQFDLQEDPHFWEEHNVQVLIRTRPINDSELSTQGFTRCLRQESPHTITWLGQPETRFTFDHVAGDIVTQERLFQVAGLPMVENCMSGYNSCMFAYGQTGSGKTHTMLGDIEHLDKRPSENRGMTPRVFEYLFERIRKEEEARKDEKLMFMCRCSFLEIYNEQIADLLEPTSTNLHMREDTRTGVYVENLSEVEVHNVQDVIHLLIQGASNRRVAATNMNRESSRSHSVFTCIVESKWERDSMTNIRFGRLNLVDLAGSERQKSSGAEGERLKEAANINKSLSTLGLVIMILVDVANGKHRHVPYRDSKLTFLLQDSLGGNSKTTIIATVSPASCNAMETLSTLKFAQRAKLIKNTAVINEDASGDVKALRLQLQLMKEELDRIRRQSITSIPSAVLPVDSSWDAARALGSPTGTNGQLKAMEAIVAGALRREKVAEEVTKQLAAEIQQLRRLVQQREEESQCGKMLLRFREEKIRRLESLSQGLVAVDTYLAEEKNMLSEEIEVLKAQKDRNPELTRFAMENIRLLDQLKSLKEFQEGKQEVMAQEISNLRDKLLEILEGKIAEDQVLNSVPKPQAISTPEFAAKNREIELLRIEVDNYRSELEHCRSNLSSLLESNAAMASQVDDLQALVQELRPGTAAAKKDPNHLVNVTDSELAEHLQLVTDLRTQLEQAEAKAKTEARKNQQLDLQLQKAVHEAQDFQNQLQDLTLNSQVLESRIRLEMEGAAELQNRRIPEKETEEFEFEDAESVMNKTSEKQGTVYQELFTSMEETRRLQLELTSSEAATSEERRRREHLEEKLNNLEKEHRRQLEEAYNKLAENQAIVEDLEIQQLNSINEIKELQESQERFALRLKRREEKERVLKKKIVQLEWELTKERELRDVEREVEHGDILSEEERTALESKLENARKELDVARELNAKFQGERDLQNITAQILDSSRSEAETETALAITSMQEELMAMEDELTDANRNEVAARDQVAQLQDELDSARKMLDDVDQQNASLRKELEEMVQEKDAERKSSQKSWESASENLIDYLADGDQALRDAVQEIEELVQLSKPFKRPHPTSKNNAVKFLHEKLQHAVTVTRETESKIKELRDIVSKMTDDPKSGSSFTIRADIRRLGEEAQTLGKARVDLTVEKEFGDSRILESEIVWRAMQADLAHAEIKLRQAEERNLELAKAQEALAVTKQEWELENVTLVRNLRETEQQYAKVRQVLSDLQLRMDCAENREEVLVVELEELRLAKKKWDMQKAELEQEILDMRTAWKKETFNDEELQNSQGNAGSSESRITGMLLEIDSFYSANRSLEVERIEASEEAAELTTLLKEKESVLHDTNNALAQLKQELQAAVEAQGSHRQQSTTWVAEKRDLLTDCASLEGRLDVTTANTKQAQEKAEKLNSVLHDFAQAEEKWKSELSGLTLLVEGLRRRLGNEEAALQVLKKENQRLEAALLFVRKEEASAMCDLTVLKQKFIDTEAKERAQLEHAERIIECNYVDLARAKVDLEGAEEKLMLAAKSRATEDWEHSEVLSEFEAAVRNYKQAGHAVESILREKEKGVLRRQKEVQVYEDEISKLMAMVTESEERMSKLESDWRKERDTLLSERDNAKLDASQRGSEAAALARNFEKHQATMQEAEMLVDALVQAKDSARSDAEGWKLENERLCLTQEIAIKNVYEETLKVLAVTNEEVGLTVNHCEKEMGTLAKDIQILKEELKQMSALRLIQKNQRNAGVFDHEASQKELDFAQVAVAEIQASVAGKDADLVALHLKLDECHGHTAEIERNHQETVTELQAELAQKVKELDLMKEELAALNTAASNAEQENLMMRDQIEELRTKAVALEADLEVKICAVGALEQELLNAEKRRVSMLQEAEKNLKEVEIQRDFLKADLLALRTELELATALVKEREAMAADACQVAQILSSHTGKVDQEISFRSSVNDLQEEQAKDKRVEELESDLTDAHRKLDHLQVQCADKDAEIEDCKARIANLMLAAEGQATEYHQKLKELESMVEQVKVEDKRLSLGVPTTPKTGEKSKSPFKGPGSPFKCIGKGMAQQRTAELDAELSAHERRIEELEGIAAARQREVFLLNTRLAEVESMFHDVTRELFGVKLEISNYAETQQHVQRLAEDVRRRTMTPDKAGRNLVQDAEIENLRVQLTELIEERESWLEDLNRRHAEIVASRISTDKMRHRDQILSAENEQLKLDNAGHTKRIVELEKDIKKLSGQQNLQQRIHHHAKIKTLISVMQQEENTALRYKNEDLCAKLRRTEILFARVNDELAKYRTAEGKTPFLNIDEEQCLKSKLQEAEDAKIQMAQKLITLYSSIVKAAGFNPNAKEVDHASALLALQKLEERIQSTEQELADTKFKSKMAGERRRLSDLRAAHSPFKAAQISGPQSIFCPSPLPR